MVVRCSACGAAMTAEAAVCLECGGVPRAVPSPATSPGPQASAFKMPVPGAAEVEMELPAAEEEKELPRRRRLTLVDGVYALVVVLVLLAVWYMSPRLVRRQEPSPPPVTTAAPTPVAAVPPQRLGAEEREAATQVLRPLQALRSATAAGVKYADYEPRVLDTKIVVERYLERGGDADLRRQAREAMDLYLLALSTWALGARKEWAEILTDRRIELCSVVAAARDAPVSSPGMTREDLQGMTVASMLPQMWACAATRIAAMEQALRER